MVVFWLSEQVFYDRIFFQKSALHGYHYWFTHADEAEGRNYFERLLLNSRLTDINNLLAEVEHPLQHISCQNLTPLKSSHRYTRQKPLTIAVIGDSVAYGLGLRQSQRLSQVLEQKINKIVPTKVYDLAEVGNGIADYYALYRLARDYLHPDLVVVTILENDLDILPPRYPNSAAIIQHLVGSCTQPIQTISVANYLDWHGVLSTYATTLSPNYANTCILDNAAALFARDPTVMFYSLFHFEVQQNCSLSATSEQCQHRRIINEYEAALFNHGNIVVGFDVEHTPMTSVSSLEGHPSAAMHRQYADDLVVAISQHFLSN